MERGSVFTRAPVSVCVYVRTQHAVVRINNDRARDFVYKYTPCQRIWLFSNTMYHKNGFTRPRVLLHVRARRAQLCLALSAASLYRPTECSPLIFVRRLADDVIHDDDVSMTQIKHASGREEWAGKGTLLGFFFLISYPNDECTICIYIAATNAYKNNPIYSRLSSKRSYIYLYMW